MTGWLWFALACSGDEKTADTDAVPVDTATGDTGDTDDTDDTDTGSCADGFADADGDGFGDPGRPVPCDDPAGVPDGTDCDDGNPDVHPGADERCDGIDGDCDPATGEDGLATFTDSSGISFDVTGAFGTSDVRNVVQIDLEDGRYDLCGGTWYVRLRGLQKDTTIDGHGSAVLDAGRSGSAIALDGGSLSATGLTVSGGLGSVPGPTTDLTGGGLACFGAADVHLDGVTFSENEAFIGGALFVLDCTVEAVSTTLTGNHATYGGGLYALDGVVSLVDSTVTSNTASNSGGGLGLEGTGPRPALTLTDTLVADNTAAFGGGLVTYENAEATCIGSPGASAGFLRNTAENVGGAVYVTGADYFPRFTSDGCDFGTGADDNVPTDVVTAYETQQIWTWGDDASFVCEPAGCG